SERASTRPSTSTQKRTTTVPLRRCVLAVVLRSAARSGSPQARQRSAENSTSLGAASVELPLSHRAPMQGVPLPPRSVELPHMPPGQATLPEKSGMPCLRAPRSDPFGCTSASLGEPSSWFESIGLAIEVVRGDGSPPASRSSSGAGGGGGSAGLGGGSKLSDAISSRCEG